MKKIQAFLLSAVCILAAALPAAAQQSVTVTLKDSTTHSFTSIDSVRLVGGNFGDPMGVGVKIYVNGSTQSHDFLYSQMLDIVITGQTITVAAQSSTTPPTAPRQPPPMARATRGPSPSTRPPRSAPSPLRTA